MKQLKLQTRGTKSNKSSPNAGTSNSESFNRMKNRDEPIGSIGLSRGSRVAPHGLPGFFDVTIRLVMHETDPSLVLAATRRIPCGPLVFSFLFFFFPIFFFFFYYIKPRLCFNVPRPNPSDSTFSIPSPPPPPSF